MKTLAAPARLAQEIRKSRFVAQAAPVADAAAALGFLQQVSVRDANHNCWAYRLGGDYRSSDDGEPAGTAGRPILQAIDGQGLDRVVVVVTRWFGGIKLGAGGLVRAYGGCAAECLRTAPQREIVPQQRCSVRCSFDDLGGVHQLLAQHAVQRLDERFEPDGVLLQLQLPAAKIAEFTVALRNVTRGRAGLEVLTPA